MDTDKGAGAGGVERGGAMSRFARTLFLVCWTALLASHAGAESSLLPGNPGTKRDPTRAADSPEYRRGLEEGDRQAREEAERRGGSHLDLAEPARGDGEEPASEPGEIGVPKSEVKVDETPDDPEEAPEDRVDAPALVEWTGTEGEGLVPVDREADDDPGVREEAGIEAYIKAIVKEIDRAPEMVRIRYGAVGEGRPDEAREPEGAAAVPSRPPLPAVGAGDALFARLLYDVNSDFPGPVMLQVLQPPLYGAVLRGGFQLVRDRMVVRVTSMDFGEETVPVDAVALGLDCACYGLSGDVSYHWFERVILPAAVGFVENFLIARSQPDRRIVQIDDGSVLSEERESTRKQAIYSGAAEAAGQVGKILLEQAPSRQTVVIPRNTELAVMFVERLERREAGAAVRAPAAVPAGGGTEGQAAGLQGVPVVVRGRGEVR